MTYASLAAGGLATLALAVSLSGAPAAGPVRFAPHDIDADFRGGYAVDVADFNKDGKPDVIANSLAVNEVARAVRGALPLLAGDNAVATEFTASPGRPELSTTSPIADPYSIR